MKKSFTLFYFLFLIISCSQAEIWEIDDEKNNIISISDAKYFKNSLYLIEKHSGSYHKYKFAQNTFILDDIIQPNPSYSDSISMKNDEFISRKDLIKVAKIESIEKLNVDIKASFSKIEIVDDDIVLLLGRAYGLQYDYIEQIGREAAKYVLRTILLKSFNNNDEILLYNKTLNSDYKYFVQDNILYNFDKYLFMHVRSYNYDNELVNEKDYPVINQYDLEGNFIKTIVKNEKINNEFNFNSIYFSPIICINKSNTILIGNIFDFIYLNEKNKMVKLQEFKSSLKLDKISSQEVEEKIKKNVPIVDFQIQSALVTNDNYLYIYYFNFDIETKHIKNNIIAKYNLDGELLQEIIIKNKNDFYFGNLFLDKTENKILYFWRSKLDGTWSFEIEDLF